MTAGCRVTIEVVVGRKAREKSKGSSFYTGPHCAREKKSGSLIDMDCVRIGTSAESPIFPARKPRLMVPSSWYVRLAPDNPIFNQSVHCPGTSFPVCIIWEEMIVYSVCILHDVREPFDDFPTSRPTELDSSPCQIDRVLSTCTETCLAVTSAESLCDWGSSSMGFCGGRQASDALSLSSKR